MLTVSQSLLKVVRLGLLRLTRGLGTWVEPHDPSHLTQQLDRGEIVWRAFVDAGIALRRCNRFAEADTMLERGLGAFPNDRTILYEHALSAHNSGRYELAITRWERALLVAPDIAMCHCGLAANLRETHQFDLAQSRIDVALRRFPDDLVVVSEAARIADARGLDEVSVKLWAQVAASKNPSPDWLEGEAQALFRLGRYSEADAVVKTGRDRFPDSQGLIAVEGLLAAARQDWPKAVTIWTAYRRRFPADTMGQTQLEQAIRASDPRFPDNGADGTPDRSPQVDIVDSEELRRLLLRFESIGDNCEFATVQRRYAAEPFGLLRWSTVVLDRLIPALEQRFAGLGEADNTELTVKADGHFIVQDRRWGLGMHFVSAPERSERDALFARTCRRILQLKEKLIADLSAADKVFVYRSEGLDGDRLEQLHRALRVFGPVRLLNVQPAAPTAPTIFQGRAGDVIRIEEGRYVGFLERLGQQDGGAWNIAFDDWITVCRKANAIA